MRESLIKQEKIAHFREQQSLHEKKLLKLENTVLRTQINPHVLYNTLNFLYAKSLPVSHELSDGILALSEIMQYSLKNQDSNGLVLLSDELEQVRNIVALARLKSKQTYINLQFQEVDSSTTIVPLLLITLVENIFKHGDVSDPSQPAEILLTMECNDRIRVIVSNKPRKAAIQQPGPHIGLSNARARFEKEYGDQGVMNISQSENLFRIEMLIPVRKRTDAQTAEKLVA